MHKLCSDCNNELHQSALPLHFVLIIQIIIGIKKEYKQENDDFSCAGFSSRSFLWFDVGPAH
jgi:hypothetical protein